MQTDSVGQGLRQGTVGWACLCPWMSGSQLRVIQKVGSGRFSPGGSTFPDAVSMGILAPGEATALQRPLPSLWLEQRVNQLAKIKCGNLTQPGPAQNWASHGHRPGAPTLVYKSGNRRPALCPSSLVSMTPLTPGPVPIPESALHLSLQPTPG